MSEACSMHVTDRRTCNILVEILEGKRPLGTFWRRWEEDNISIDLEEIGWEDAGFILLPEDKANDGLLWTRQTTFRFQSMMVMWVAEQSLPSQEGIDSMELKSVIIWTSKKFNFSVRPRFWQVSMFLYRYLIMCWIIIQRCTNFWSYTASNEVWEHDCEKYRVLDSDKTKIWG
jgi:hypothetical protein